MFCGFRLLFLIELSPKEIVSVTFKALFWSLYITSSPDFFFKVGSYLVFLWFSRFPSPSHDNFGWGPWWTHWFSPPNMSTCHHCLYINIYWWWFSINPMLQHTCLWYPIAIQCMLSPHQVYHFLLVITNFSWFF